ncbi:MAG: PQQ-binding-like beta-propeller repeat protein [Jatrophihabitans sp.]|uniref:PQQ-binding-like beta-propeller repeat protein n=1 Tax=Jatrophihabitans sp. TaxID=1932789 RepID=UPI00390D89C4
MPIRLVLTAVVTLSAGLALTFSTGTKSGSSPGATAVGPAVRLAASTTYPNWPTYHGTNYRHGDSASMPAVSGSPQVITTLALDGAVYGSPIVIRGWTILATENNTVYAFDASYRLRWSTHLGSPSPASQRPCGNIDPLGITGTPAWSATTESVYVAPEFSGPTHQLYALYVGTGAIRFHHSLDLSGVDPTVMQQRGALLVDAHRVFVPFGGLAGDCGQYKGRVVGYSEQGTGNPISYTVPTAREAGIWTPPGLTGDYYGHIFAAVGNGASGVGGSYDHSDSILNLSASLALTDYFSPSTWAADNDADLDLGSQGATIVGSFVFAVGKSGSAYVLRRNALGHVGGQVSKASVCKSFGGTAVSGSVVFVPCLDGLRAVQIDSAGVMHVLWHTSTNITGSPVYGGGRVWSLDPGAGVLYALDPNTGAVREQVTVGAVTRFATPAIYGRDLRIPTKSGATVARTS